jgi:Ala-tRNA(Pro) deacylase
MSPAAELEENAMPASALKRFLDSRGVKYVSLEHSPAYTAPEVAESAHIAGSDFAKTVIVRIDGRLAMVVVPANRKIVLSDLRDLLASEDVELASEDEFKGRFPDCEIGAMSPFGNLYDMPVYLDQSLMGNSELAFNAGTHREVIKMASDDFLRTVNPTVVDLVTA